jgi:hypothetical protein
VIRFTLRCRASHEFEGWFKNNELFEQQAADGALSCPVCGDREVGKAIMAPAIARSGSAIRSVPGPEGEPASDPKREPLARMIQLMRAVRTHVEANFDDVGQRFPEEARRMHFGEIEHRDIYGQASRQEVKELLDDGVQIQPLPMVPKLDG